jgi:hypothetical protein
LLTSKVRRLGAECNELRRHRRSSPNSSETLQYVEDRKAFGQPIGALQQNRSVMPEFDPELEIAAVDERLQSGRDSGP